MTIFLQSFDGALTTAQQETAMLTAMKKLKLPVRLPALALALVLSSVPNNFAEANNDSRANPEPAHELTLKFRKKSPLESSMRSELFAQGLALLKSSNFNSFNRIPVSPGTGEESTNSDWGTLAIQQSYRTTIAGNYLVISFHSPQKISTVGADLMVQEIVIGLNGEQYAGPVFSIDPEGRIISHAKFSGPLCVKLFEYIKTLPNGC
jgi:hypothetical protein